MEFTKYIFILIAALSIQSCIDPLGVETDSKRNLLVVEGALTSDFGPHEIRLSQSAKYGSILDDQIQKVSGASVFIRDEEGNQVSLKEDNAGSYYTPSDYRGMPNTTYSLVINLSNGTQYISTPEKMAPAPSINDLKVEWKKQPSTSDIQFDSGFEIYATFQDDPNSENFYLWIVDGIYYIESRPDLYVEPSPWGPSPSPKDCCAECYVYEETNDLNIFADNFNNGNEVTQLAGYLPDNGRRFASKYLVSVEQRSLNKGAYQFFELLKNQLSIQGNIFDPPPAKIGTNIINVTEPDQEVIGYFVVSDIARDSVYISDAMADEKQPKNVLNDDCRVLNGATVMKPPFWVE